MKRFCDNCQKMCEVTTQELTDKFKVGDIEVEATITILRCNECGEEVWDREIEKKNDIIVFDKYKAAKHLLTSNEIKEIREKYALSQSAFSRILGFGEKTITRYENGAIQDSSHDLLIKLMKDTANFKKVWMEMKHTLSDKENERIKDLIGEKEIRSASFDYSSKGQTKVIIFKPNCGGLRNVEC